MSSVDSRTCLPSRAQERLSLLILRIPHILADRKCQALGGLHHADNRLACWQGKPYCGLQAGYWLLSRYAMPEHHHGDHIQSEQTHHQQDTGMHRRSPSAMRTLPVLDSTGELPPHTCPWLMGKVTSQPCMPRATARRHSKSRRSAHRPAVGPVVRSCGHPPCMPGEPPHRGLLVRPHTRGRHRRLDTEPGVEQREQDCYTRAECEPQDE